VWLAHCIQGWPDKQELFPKVRLSLVLGDPCSQATLREAGVEKADAVILGIVDLTVEPREVAPTFLDPRFSSS
jgi:voltage-gated potassium channel Kch